MDRALKQVVILGGDGLAHGRAPSADQCGRLLGLDALRGIAAIVVTLLHALAVSGTSAFEWIDHGYLMVDFFFLLSGFVLARTYEERMPSAGRFLAMRWRRLWLPIALGLVLGAGWSLAAGEPIAAVLPMAVRELLFIPTGWNWPHNLPMWSILFELFANVLHAALLWRLPMKLLACIAASCAIVLSRYPDLDLGLGEMFWGGFPRVLMSYCLGIILWRCRDRLPRVGFAYAVMALLTAVVAASRSAAPWWADMGFVLIVSPIVLIGGLSGAPRYGVWLGALSFPLYAVHWPVLIAAFGSGLGLVPAFALALGTAVLTGLAADRRFRDIAARALHPSTAAPEPVERQANAGGASPLGKD